MSMAHGDRWLSTGVETLRERLHASQAASWDCDVLVIGSGYGGAVAAARLAGRRTEGRPAEVWVLERGREWLPGTFPARFAELAGAVRFSAQDGAAPRGNPLGLYDVRLGADVNVLVGSGLGGGSLINAAVMARPQDEIFASGWPTGIDAAAMRQHFDAAEQMLQVGPFATTHRPRKLLALDRLAQHDLTCSRAPPSQARESRVDLVAAHRQVVVQRGAAFGAQGLIQRGAGQCWRSARQRRSEPHPHTSDPARDAIRLGSVQNTEIGVAHADLLRESILYITTAPRTTATCTPTPAR